MLLWQVNESSPGRPDVSGECQETLHVRSGPPPGQGEHGLQDVGLRMLGKDMSWSILGSWKELPQSVFGKTHSTNNLLASYEVTHSHFLIISFNGLHLPEIPPETDRYQSDIYAWW